MLEWLDASLYDAVQANGGRGLPLHTVQVVLRQLLVQLDLLHQMGCIHTDIKHKNCCLVSSAHFWLPGSGSQRRTFVLTDPQAKFIDYGNATYDHERKIHPIHTKQFRAPEVLLRTA